MSNIYDIIIIGGGISGLYSAYNIQKINPTVKILILEASSKKLIGGRLGNTKFHGVTVVTGAGIGRKEKDFLLIELLNELKIPYGEFTVKSQMVNSQMVKINELKEMVNKLKKEEKNENKKLTFKEYATKVLGKENYKKFCIYSGYTDFEKEDFHQTLFNYGLEDNYKEYTGLSIPWKLLIHTLAEKVKWKNIKFLSKVSRFTKSKTTNINTNINTNTNTNTNNNTNTNTNTNNKNKKIIIPNFTIFTEDGIKYLCNKIIVATTINLVKKLFSNLSIYKQINKQPFLRVYAKFSKQSIPIMLKYVNITTIVEGPLHKIIPINVEKGIYMVAYTDNKDAIFINKLLNSKQTNLSITNLINKALNIEIEIDDLIYFYWDIGTHYYEPLINYNKNYKNFIKNIQHPADNILVVGEMVSNNQGWTEGALNSVQKVLTKKWIENYKF